MDNYITLMLNNFINRSQNSYREDNDLFMIDNNRIEIVGKAYFSNISALLSKLDRAQHSDLVLTIFLEVSI